MSADLHHCLVKGLRKCHEAKDLMTLPLKDELKGCGLLKGPMCNLYRDNKIHMYVFS